MVADIAQRLRETREGLGLTRGAAAEQAGVPFGSLVRWERGDNAPNPIDLLRLCTLYDVSVDWILGRAPSWSS